MVVEAKPLRVTFVHSPDPTYADTQNYGAQFMPVWAYTLAAHIPEDGGYDLQLYDTRVDDIAAIAEADVYLFSGINQDFTMLSETRRQLKQRYPAMISLIGGPICWSFEQAGDLNKLADFDHIFIGDGEDAIGELLGAIASGTKLAHIIKRKDRFEIGAARPMNRQMMKATLSRYYGGVLEVSRGCPFLCEFCDIRILPDNNRPHNKSALLIVEEIDFMCRNGAQQILLACDNFIGEPRWAEEVVDAILEWQSRTGFRPSLYTWLTINLYKQHDLMRKMRLAGFDMLFIGVESFSSNSLLETAKVQNTTASLEEAIKEIQAFGFVVVGGLIFGFDSDDETSFEQTLKGLLDSGMLSGDPSLLTALPGTPLYRRIKAAKRLRDVRYGLGGFKYQTNIRYLMPSHVIIDGYKRFIKRFTDGSYQYARLEAFFDNLERGYFVPLDRTGYGNLTLFATMVLRNPAALWQLLQRIGRFARRPTNLYWALRGVLLALSRRHIRGGMSYVQFWGFAWSNAILKYRGLSAADFDIDGIEGEVTAEQILPASYTEGVVEAIPRVKTEAQLRATTKQLHSLIEQRVRKAG